MTSSTATNAATVVIGDSRHRRWPSLVVAYAFIACALIVTTRAQPNVCYPPLDKAKTPKMGKCFTITHTFPAFFGQEKVSYSSRNNTIAAVLILLTHPSAHPSTHRPIHQPT